MKTKLKESHRQFCWIKNIRRDDLLNNKPILAQFIKNAYTCGRHFVGGHPAPQKLKDNINWISTLNLG
jgi:hypothetical protein